MMMPFSYAVIYLPDNQRLFFFFVTITYSFRRLTFVLMEHQKDVIYHAYILHVLSILGMGMERMFRQKCVRSRFPLIDR